MIVGSLGKIIFMVSSKYIKTIDELKGVDSVNYAEHQIIGSKPKLQFLNVNLQTLTFKIRLSAFHNVNPLAAYKELNDYMKNGEPVRFIMGTRSKGKFVITSLNHDHKKFSAIGTVSVLEAEVSIKEYN